MRVLLSLLCIAMAAVAEDVCKSASPLTGFKPAEYLGVWHQIAVSRRFFETIEKNYPRCIYANYSLNPAGYINVENVGYNAAGGRNVANGKATQADPSVARLEVSFGGSPPGPYSVIKMLYDNEGKYRVALVWSCAVDGLVNDLWVLARTPTISREDYETMIGFATNSGIDVAKLQMMMTNQTNCPAPRGQGELAASRASTCDAAKPITGFKTAEYLGVWYQMAVSKQFQEVFEGQYPLCIVANYSLNPAGYVNVANSGYNAAGAENLAIGKATQADPSVASLEVSFSGSPPAPYNVIKMLYDNEGKYKVALVWSCQLNGLVNCLWVLSRTRTISSEDYDTMINFAKQSGIDVVKLDMVKTNQTNCPN